MRVIDYMDGMTPRVLIKRHVMGVLRSMTPRKAVNAAVFMAQRSYKPLRPINKPLFLKIEPTNCCDLKCPGCGTHHPRGKGFMKMETFRDLLAAYGRWCVRISLYGEGEPLLHPQIFEMVETAEKARCPVSISSNFNSLDPEKIEKLLDSGLEHVIVCIDGASRETHCMYRVDSD